MADRVVPIQAAAPLRADPGVVHLMTDDEKRNPRARRDDRPPRYSENRIAADFAQRHAGRFIFIPEWGRWLQWNDVCWTADAAGAAHAQMAADLAQLAQEALADPETGDSVATRSRFARSLNSAKTLHGVETFAKVVQELVVPASNLDNHAHLLSTPDGVIDLRTGAVAENLPALFITKATRVAPGEGDGTVEEFIDAITCNDGELADYLQMALGACLFASNFAADHWLLFCYGPGANGKSTLLDAMVWILADYAKVVPAATLMATEHGSEHPTIVANLASLRLAVSSEVAEGARWGETKIKAQTGDAMLTGRFMRRDYFEFPRTHRHVVLGNHRPLLHNPDVAIARRLHLVPFNADFTGARGDPTMPERLRAQAPALLAWLCEGARRYYQAGAKLMQTGAVKDATAAYLEAHSTFDQWLEERCTRAPGAQCRTLLLFADFKIWKEGRGERAPSLPRFAEDLGRRFERYHTNAERGFRGVKLATGGLL